MKTIKNTILFTAAILLRTISAADDVSHNVPNGGMFEFTCSSGQQCCTSSKFGLSSSDATRKLEVQITGPGGSTTDRNCLQGVGTFENCEDPDSGCTVTCSPGCTTTTDFSATASGDTSEANGDTVDGDEAVTASGDTSDANEDTAGGDEAAVSKSEVITLAWTTVGFVFAAVFLAI